MGNPSTTPLDDAASDLLDRWMAHRQESGGVYAELASEPPAELATVEPEPVAEVEASPEPVPVAEVEASPEPVTATEVVESTPITRPEPIETAEGFEEFAHPTLELGGAPGAPSPSDLETSGETSLQASAPSPETTGAPVPHLTKRTKSPKPLKPPEASASPKPPPTPPTPVRRPTPTPAPGLVLFSPRRGFRHILTGTAALLAAGVGIAGYIAWQTRTPESYGLAGGLVAVLFVVWKLRGRSTGAHITIEDGMLRIVQGKGRHLFPLTSAHPPIDILGEPGQRAWKVLIQRRGMPPFVITRKMVEPSQFSEAIRHFRPDA